MVYLDTNIHYRIIILSSDIKVDVLDTLHSQLLKEINNSNEFETVQRLHDQFLATAISQCWVQVKTISRYVHYLSSVNLSSSLYDIMFSFLMVIFLRHFRCLDQIFNCCITFCNLVVRLERDNRDREKEVEHLRKIDDLAKEFDRQSSFLYSILVGMKNHKQSSAQLQTLILTLNYNNHFTKV